MSPRIPRNSDAEIRRVYEETGSISATALKVGVDRRNLARRMRRLGISDNAVSPLLPVADGQIVSGFSTLIRNSPEDAAKTGIVQQWVKSKADDNARVESMHAAVAALCERASKRSADATPEPVTMSELMAVIPLGDPHVGMLSHAAETGADWSIAEAERVLVGAARKAINICPPAARCLIINLGDFFHADDQSNRTARSGNQLDVAARWSVVVPAGIRIIRDIVDACLQKFGHVTVDNVRGNHDEHSSFWLSQVLAAYYSREPRVSVDVSPSLHRYHVHGQCLIGTHHGHTAKFEALPLLMAATEPEKWGLTKHRHIYCGHVHRDQLTEYAGCKVETVNTLAARDAYAAGAGYVSGREIKADIWHEKRGLINRHNVGVGEL